MHDANPDRGLDEALAHHHAGRRAEAEALCQGLLERDPRHAGALHLLAQMAQAQKRFGPAIKLARMALAAAPTLPAYRDTLGTILGDLRQWDECFAAFAEAIRLDPAGFNAHRNLGIALAKALRPDEAVAPLQRAAEIRPDDPEVWTLLASVHHGRLDLPAAIECRRRALSLRPDDAPAHSDLLATLHYSQNDSPGELFAEHLAWACRHEEPILSQFPERPFENDRDPDRPLRVGYLSGDFRDHPIARFLFPLLVAHDRARVAVYCYSDVPRPDRQTERLRARADTWRDVSAMDDDAVADAIRGDRIDVLVDLAGHLDNRRLLVFARRPAPVQVTYIGYSDTTGMRSIGYRITDAFHDPLESDHAGELWEAEGAVTSPSPGTPGEGGVGVEPRPSGASRQSGSGCTNERPVAHAVHARGSLAPIVACTAGESPHPNPPPEYREREKDGAHAPSDSPLRTGLPAGAQTVRGADPAGPPSPGVPRESAETDTLHTEQLVRLPGCCWAYDAGDDPAPPAVGPLPAAASGRVTFAVFNRLIKATPRMASLWSEILQRVPGSRLLVLDSAGAGEAALRAALGRLGLIGADIGARGRGTRAEYLARYHEVDIALDTHPYAGVTTTCDALWMGVPMVTLAGNTHVSRSGVSLLSAVDLPELIARSAEEYVEIAVRVATDLPRLAAMRAGLRERMRQSPLCDGARLAREVEAAYRGMWKNWCNGVVMRPAASH